MTSKIISLKTLKSRVFDFNNIVSLIELLLSSQYDLSVFILMNYIDYIDRYTLNSTLRGSIFLNLKLYTDMPM